MYHAILFLYVFFFSDFFLGFSRASLFLVEGFRGNFNSIDTESGAAQ